MRNPRDMRPAVAAVLAAAGAVAIQSLWLPVDADVSWLITVAERILWGDRLYLDILEVNPPASVWLYLPLVWLAQLSGLPAEAVVVATFVVAGLASIWATVRLASSLDGSTLSLWLSATLGLVVLVLPMALFAQREHAALILAFPALTALAVIAEGKPLGRRALLSCGFAAGVIIVIKPYFLLAVIAPALWAAWKRRTLSPLLPGIAAGATAIGLYAIAVLLFARSYLDWVPVIAHTYAPMHELWWKVFVGPTLYPAMCVALAILMRPPRIPSMVAMWALGSAGFVLAAFLQGKNYPNHWLPGAGMALAAAFALLAQPGIKPVRKAAVGGGLAAVSLMAMYYWAIRPDPAVATVIQRVGPPAPKMIALSPQLTTGHPVTRNVGGQWVGSRPSLFLAGASLFVGLEDEIARRAYREDIRSFAIDVQRHSPDIVLVDRKSKEWLMGEEEIAPAMGRYRLAGESTDTEIWVRHRRTP
ncbi:MAG: hypothetical protein ACR2JJ_07350 [Sphingomicrobium sp.]